MSGRGASGRTGTELSGRGASGRTGTELSGRGASGRTGTELSGRGASGRTGTLLSNFKAEAIAAFVTTTRTRVTTSERTRFEVEDMVDSFQENVLVGVKLKLK